MMEMTKHVLVVDDEQDVRNYLRTALEDAGFRVSQANDGFEALQILQRDPPDLISLDLVMPRHSGAMFHRELQKHHAWAKIPVLIVTGHARDDLGKADLEELTMSGPGVYLEKPVSPHAYIGAVCQLLGLEPLGKNVEDAGKRRDELREKLNAATLEELRRALEILNK